MVQNFVFQDNIYHLARSIDVLYEGLQLNLDECLYAEKVVYDVRFFDHALQKLCAHIDRQSHFPDYLPILHCLFSCGARFLNLLNFLIHRASPVTAQVEFTRMLPFIEKRHSALHENLARSIQEVDTSADASHVVSQDEIDELLEH
ncbi:hypothetical protein TPSea814_000064 [Treponema pallidum subsp. pallidum str. Sea 81-4]|nr:conserved hypothetical protein [Treponema pallidum subsp. pallidum str. Chicago]AHN66767.1 hypothetical protein TPSea814_000064 [Treponema pallidum subsp. pallidum str. Sea 81-4]